MLGLMTVRVKPHVLICTLNKRWNKTLPLLIAFPYPFTPPPPPVHPIYSPFLAIPRTDLQKVSAAQNIDGSPPNIAKEIYETMLDDSRTIYIDSHRSIGTILPHNVSFRSAKAFYEADLCPDCLNTCLINLWHRVRGVRPAR